MGSFAEWIEAFTSGRIAPPHQTITKMLSHLEIGIWLPYSDFPSCLVQAVERLSGRKLGSIPRIKAASKDDWRDAYNEDAARRIAEWAADDFEAFGYDPEGWRK